MPVPESAQINQLIRELAESSRSAETLRAAHPAAELLRRSGEQRWSAAECIEHLNLTNRAYLAKIDKALAKLHEKELKGDEPYRLEWNARLLKFWLEPPSRLRLPTTAPFQPVKAKDATITFMDFFALNEQLTERLKSARDLDLSAAKIASPFAENVKYSVYSAFVLIGAHNRRHLWQAESALSAIRHK